MSKLATESSLPKKYNISPKALAATIKTQIVILSFFNIFAWVSYKFLYTPSDWVMTPLKPFYLYVFPAVCLIFIILLKKDLSRGFLVSNNGIIISYGKNQFLIHWENMTLVKSKKNYFFQYLIISIESTENRYPARFLKHGIPLLWPLDNPEAFKADIQTFAPEGNPLREWVEKNL